MIISGINKVGTNADEINVNDLEMVDEVLQKLKVSRDNVTKQSRLETGNSNSNLIVVEFKETQYLNRALMHSSSLKEQDKFKQVYINRDKTRDERKYERLLRQERNKRNSDLTVKDEQGRPYGLHNDKKFYWGIRYDELNRIYIE